MTNTPRIPLSKAGDASAGQLLQERVGFFWFFYNWDTREKRVYQGDDPRIPDVTGYSRWEYLYHVSVGLPVPVAQDQRQIIHLEERVFGSRSEAFTADEPLVYQIGRRLFVQMGSIIPNTSSDNPLRNSWGSGSGNPLHERRSYFTTTTNGRTFRVTVEDITPEG